MGVLLAVIYGQHLHRVGSVLAAPVVHWLVLLRSKVFLPRRSEGNHRPGQGRFHPPYGLSLLLLFVVNFLVRPKAEVRRMHHGRASGSVKLHSWIATLDQQGAEAETGRLGVLGLTRRRWFPRPQAHGKRRTRGRIFSDSTHTEVPNFAEGALCDIHHSA